MKRKNFKRLIWLLLILAGIAAVIWYIWPRLPIITAFAAKGMASSVFLAGKDPDRVKKEDLSFFPINLAKTKIDYQNKTVTSTVFGLAERKAVFRKGLGSVIVLETPVEELRSASFEIPDPGFSQDTISWPKGDLLPANLPEGVNYERLNELIDTSFDRAGGDAVKKTLGIAVVYNNVIIAEQYLGDYDYTTMFHAWSMTKTVAGALAGILVEKEMLELDDPVDFIKQDDNGQKKMDLENVIHMSSGLDWYENYFTISDATIMLMQSPDMLASVTDNELEHDPGSFWNYSSGDANLLSGIIRAEIDDDLQYHRLPYEELFYPAGMLHTMMETDASGLFVASSYSYGSVRDWARFGLLFLNEGVLNGDTILSEEWVKFMKTPAPSSGGKYAGTFWLEEPSPENALMDVPDDVFFADGFLGQRVYIIPSKNLVVVRMGYGMSNFNMNDFLREIIETLPE